jgi:hypothetical protein
VTAPERLVRVIQIERLPRATKRWPRAETIAPSYSRVKDSPEAAIAVGAVASPEHTVAAIVVVR